MVRSSSNGAPGADARSASEEAERLAAPELPPFLEAFAPQVEEVPAVLDRFTGFALVPVEVPSRDVAILLAARLTLAGRRLHVVASDAQWQTLTAAIVAAPPGAEGIALIMEPPHITSSVRASLRLLNQRRDTVAERLGAPLLWCGSADFFRATAELAPDFWSVRELPLRIVVPPGFSRSAAIMDLPLQDNQPGSRLGSSAYRMGDVNVVDLRDGLFSSTALADQHHYARRILFASSSLPIDQPTIDRVVEVLRETTDMRDLARALEVAARMAIKRADRPTAEANFREAYGLFGDLSDRAGKARCARALGMTLGASKRMAEAEAWFSEALGLAREMDDWQEGAESARALAQIRLRSGDAAAARALLEIAHRRFVQLHDAAGLATVHVLNSLALAAMADLEGARQEAAAAARLAEETGIAEVKAQALGALAAVDIIEGHATEVLVSLRRATTLLLQAGNVGELEYCARLARLLPDDVATERDALIVEIEQHIAILRSGASAVDLVSASPAGDSPAAPSENPPTV